MPVPQRRRLRGRDGGRAEAIQSPERPGHSHPGFTMHTYQHLPGMSAAAAERFAILVAAASR